MYNANGLLDPCKIHHTSFPLHTRHASDNIYSYYIPRFKVRTYNL